MDVTRRTFVGAAAAAGVLAAGPALADAPAPAASPAAPDGPPMLPATQLPLSVAAGSPWMSNAVALTRDNTIFLGLPRFVGHEDTPSVVRVQADGRTVPFPGEGWNDWKPGGDGRNAFVYVNSVHIFADNTVWCVDQGAERADSAAPGAQKLVQLDPESGRVIQVIRFAPEILPPGSKLNDLRLYGPMIYMTESGLGALIVYDTRSGRTLRRLAGTTQVKGTPWGAKGGPQHAGVKPKHGIPNADIIEITPDGEWMLWGAPTGPMWRVPTALLRDPTIGDAELVTKVELAFKTPVMGGTAMDTRGNIYLSDILGRRVILISPSGQRAVLASSPDLISPDAMFIGADRRIYIPATQAQLTAEHTGGTDLTKPPFQIFSVQLPDSLAGIQLGGQLNGAVAT